MILVEPLKNRILKYKLYDDNNGALCYFTLDLDRYELSISGECQANYKWYESSNETFIDLMLRCEQDYLCDKLGLYMEKEFDLDKSKEKTIERMKQYFKDKEEDGEEFNKTHKERALYLVENLENCGEEMFWHEMEWIITHYLKPTYPEDYCAIVKEYPYWLTRSVQYFCENIKPMLEQYKKENQ